MSHTEHPGILLSASNIIVHIDKTRNRMSLRTLVRGITKYLIQKQRCGDRRIVVVYFVDTLWPKRQPSKVKARLVIANPLILLLPPYRQ